MRFRLAERVTAHIRFAPLDWNMDWNRTSASSHPAFQWRCHGRLLICKVAGAVYSVKSYSRAERQELDGPVCKLEDALLFLAKAKASHVIVGQENSALRHGRKGLHGLRRAHKEPIAPMPVGAKSIRIPTLPIAAAVGMNTIGTRALSSTFWDKVSSQLKHCEGVDPAKAGLAPAAVHAQLQTHISPNARLGFCRCEAMCMKADSVDRGLDGIACGCEGAHRKREANIKDYVQPRADDPIVGSMGATQSLGPREMCKLPAPVAHHREYEAKLGHVALH